MEYGCIGETLSHSFSQIIHNELCDYRYELRELTAEELPAFMTKADFKAINVTIPYKQAVIPYLYEISDTARAIGAVNTVVNREGRLYGYNTDFSGMAALIRKNGMQLFGKKVLILGSGGTSKTALAVAKHLGAREVTRVSRRESDSTVTYEAAKTRHADAEVILNTTPCGMYPNIGTAAVELSDYPKLEAVVDAVYNPLSPALVTLARERGIRATGGLYMLVAQAAFAAEKFTGAPVAPAEIDRVYQKLLSEKENLVLIGMPGSGKSTVGKAAAQALGKRFVDTDEEIVKTAGKPIPAIFEEAGEAGFRQIEAQVIRKIAALQGCVIATGGGAVLNRENIRLLKENGRTVFLDRPLRFLVTTDDRPLSSNRALLEQRYRERYPIYCALADHTVSAVQELEDNVQAVVAIALQRQSAAEGSNP